LALGRFIYFDLQLVRAVFIGTLADVDAVVAGLDVDDGHLIPNFGDGQNLTMTEQLVDDVFVVVNHWVKSPVNYVVPFHVSSWVTSNDALEGQIKESVLRLSV
jgi:hypothetical protein